MILLSLYSLLLATPAEIAITKQPSKEDEKVTLEQIAQQENERLNNLPFKPYNQLSEVLEGGAIIVLKDLSKWEINEEGRIYSSGWLGPARIKIVKEKDSQGMNYPFKITNLATKVTVSARRLE